jgi:hypothetical protein
VKTHLITEETGSNKVQDINTIINSAHPTSPETTEVKSGHNISERNIIKETEKKRATFTYSGKETGVITKLLKNTYTGILENRKHSNR